MSIELIQDLREHEHASNGQLKSKTLALNSKYLHIRQVLIIIKTESTISWSSSSFSIKSFWIPVSGRCRWVDSDVDSAFPSSEMEPSHSPFSCFISSPPSSLLLLLPSSSSAAPVPEVSESSKMVLKGMAEEPRPLRKGRWRVCFPGIPGL